MGVPIERHINYVDKSISSPLHLAVRGGNLEVIKLCIAHGAKIDQQQVEKSGAMTRHDMHDIHCKTMK